MRSGTYEAKPGLITKIAALTGIGIVAGAVLEISLKIVQLITGNDAYILLFNLDYMPVLKQWNDTIGAGAAFHYLTCIGSVLFLYFLLRPFRLQYRILPYVLVYGGGGGLLYFLSALTDTPPAWNDFMAWFWWTGGHAIFGLVSGGLIRLLRNGLLKE